MKSCDGDLFILPFLPYKIDTSKMVFIDDKGFITDNKTVFIYDKTEDTFYSATQAVKYKVPKIFHKHVFTAQLNIYFMFLAVATLVCFISYFFDSFISAYFWNIYTFSILVVGDILLSYKCIARLKIGNKSLTDIHNYCRSDLKKVEYLQTIAQRQKFFRKYKTKTRFGIVLFLIVFILLFLIHYSVVILYFYSTIYLFLVLISIFFEILLAYLITFYYPDKNMKYLLHKFASKGE